jgi:FHA domain-containing protein
LRDVLAVRLLHSLARPRTRAACIPADTVLSLLLRSSPESCAHIRRNIGRVTRPRGRTFQSHPLHPRLHNRNRLQSTAAPSADRSSEMTRYRLRFLLQEFDLPPGITTLGRGLECNVTFDDPLVSRRHARIVVGEQGVRIEDTGSRNGVTVNGAVIRGPTPLRNSDRVRIGTQEFVFCELDPAAPAPASGRATGHLRLCASCGLAYPREMVSCPECEDNKQIDDDDTLTGDVSSEARGASSVQLLVEALERALALGRAGDAQRLVRRTTEQVAQLVAAGGTVNAEVLAALAAQATQLTVTSRDPTWALWALDIYCRTGQIPPVDVVERLAEVGKAAARHAAGEGGLTGSLRPLGIPAEPAPISVATSSER